MNDLKLYRFLAVGASDLFWGYPSAFGLGAAFAKPLEKREAYFLGYKGGAWSILGFGAGFDSKEETCGLAWTKPCSLAAVLFCSILFYATFYIIRVCF